MANILIVDDDELYCEMLSSKLEAVGHGAKHELRLDSGLKKASACEFDVVFLDVNMPDGNGLELIERFHETPGAPEIIIITGAGDLQGAEIAIRTGAWDYIQKGDSVNKIVLPLSRALEYREERIFNHHAAKALDLQGIVGNSSPMKKSYDLLAQAANSSSTVLITGETGTGKELFARAIHENSNRAGNSFVVVDCASLPETLMESVLFGHIKGSFTGADQNREGLILQADGGTLFLDEIAELPLSMQKAFLRVLQERTFRPVGANQEVKSNFRLIAATNRNTEQEVGEGRFRIDLFYRIKGLEIELPPLRDRNGDVKALVEHHLVRLCEREGMGIKGISPDFFEALENYDWPGNVRELVQAMDSALSVAGRSQTLYAMHLPLEVRVRAARNAVKNAAGTNAINNAEQEDSFPSYEEMRDTTAADYLRDLLSHARGNIEIAANASGLSRSRLYALMKKYAVSKSA